MSHASDGAFADDLCSSHYGLDVLRRTATRCLRTSGDLYKTREYRCANGIRFTVFALHAALDEFDLAGMECAAELGDESAIKGITGAAPGAMEHARELVCGIEDG